jgi:transcription initiation factor TFIID subunit TAF12
MSIEIPSVETSQAQSLVQKQVSPNKSASMINNCQLGKPGGDLQINPESFLDVHV